MTFWKSTRFLREIVKYQVMLYAAVTLAFLLLTLIVADSDVLTLAVTTVGSMIVALMFYLSPLVLVRMRSIDLLRMLPVSTGYKIAGVLGYFYVIVPLVSVALFTVAIYIMGTYRPEMSSGLALFVQGMGEGMAITNGTGILAYITPTAICLYCMTACRSHALTKAVLWPIAVEAALGILGGVWGFMMAIRGEEMANPEEVMSSIEGLALVLNLLMFVVGVAFTVGACRKLNHR